MLNEFGYLFLYISGFGFSDLILDELNLKSREKKILYFSFTFLLGIIMYNLFGEKK